MDTKRGDLVQNFGGRGRDWRKKRVLCSVSFIGVVILVGEKKMGTIETAHTQEKNS